MPTTTRHGLTGVLLSQLQVGDPGAQARFRACSSPLIRSWLARELASVAADGQLTWLIRNWARPPGRVVEGTWAVLEAWLELVRRPPSARWSLDEAEAWLEHLELGWLVAGLLRIDQAGCGHWLFVHLHPRLRRTARYRRRSVTEIEADSNAGLAIAQFVVRDEEWLARPTSWWFVWDRLVKRTLALARNGGGTRPPDDELDDQLLLGQPSTEPPPDDQLLTREQLEQCRKVLSDSELAILWDYFVLRLSLREMLDRHFPGLKTKRFPIQSARSKIETIQHKAERLLGNKE